MVLAEIDVDNIYVVCGYTDMRKYINGLTAIIVQQYQMRPNDRCLFLFCGRRADRLTALLWEGDGFLLLYKVLINFRYHWPRNAQEVKAITPPQYQRLLEGLEIERKSFKLPKHLV